MSDFFGKLPFERRPEKIEREKERFDQRRICWCGNPDCPGGSIGGAPPMTADEVSNSRDNPMSDPYVDRARIDDLLMREMRRMQEDQMRMWRPNFTVGPVSSSLSAPPASYTAAREKIKDLILDVQHETAWEEIVGNDDARQALVEAIEEPKNNPELYEYYGMKPPKGIMLFGLPGCGKTMFAKASAAAIGRIYGAKAEVVVVNGPSIQSPYVGKTEEKIRDIFAYAREYQKFHKHPLTVFFDEAEVLFPDRTGRTRPVAPWEESNVAQFLSEMDGLNALGAFFILATNRPEAIDEALLRDGRCDRKIKVNRPTQEATEQILRKSFDDVPLHDDLDALVMAAAESFFNPNYVIHEGHVIGAMLSKDGPKFKEVAINFCLEHIVSGSMVAGVARRAKSRAFKRDKAESTRTGIMTADVISAVNEIFQENKGLEHAFALREFKEGLPIKELLEPKGNVQ